MNKSKVTIAYSDGHVPSPWRYLNGSEILDRAAGIDGQGASFIGHGWSPRMRPRVNPDRHARIRAKHFTTAWVSLAARAKLRLERRVVVDGQPQVVITFRPEDLESVRFAEAAHVAGEARRNCDWGCP